MTIDLTMLVWSAVLAYAQFLPYAIGRSTGWGLPVLVGNRDNTPEDAPWVARAVRAHWNMLESLPVFAALVLVAHFTVPGNATVALGAQLFFWARLAYVPIYIIGIPWVRTIVWTVATIGMVLILSRLV
jgi:uncharacterized MAPEG superfamily protein